MNGVFIRETGAHYASAIVQGWKPIETRTRHTLRQLVGERVAVVRTGCKGGPVVIGYVTISKAEFVAADDLDGMRDLTLIPKGSRYDCTGAGKWCYTMTDPEECEPFPLPTDAVRHGRVWCEF